MTPEERLVTAAKTLMIAHCRHHNSLAGVRAMPQGDIVALEKTRIERNYLDQQEAKAFSEYATAYSLLEDSVTETMELPTERVARQANRRDLAIVRLNKANRREDRVLKELRDAREAKEELRLRCKNAAEATDKAMDAWLDANLEYDAAFKAAKEAQ